MKRLFDLDYTLLRRLDCDGRLTVFWAGATLKATPRDTFYEQYKAGTLNIVGTSVCDQRPARRTCEVRASSASWSR
jgi:hypothetical protein